MARDNKIIARKKIHETSSEKRTRLQNLNSQIDFKKFEQQSNIQMDVLKSAFVPSDTQRKSWRKRKRQSVGVYKNKKSNSFCKEKLATFEANEKILTERFSSLKDVGSLENLLLLIYDFQFYAPGSGILHILIRNVGEKFFKKEIAHSAWSD